MHDYQHLHVHPHEVMVRGSSLIHYIIVMHLDEHVVQNIHCNAHENCVETLCHIHATHEDVRLTKAAVTCMDCLIHDTEGPSESESENIGNQVAAYGQRI